MNCNTRPPRRRALGIGDLLLALIICVCATPSAISAQGSLSVTVLDQRSTPLSGAQILVDELSRGGSTDEGGSATVSDVAAGSYTVRVTLIGYSPDSRVVVVVDGETSHITFVLALEALELEGLVVVGNRSRPRTVAGSMVAIDALTPADFMSQAETDVGDLLRTVVPSFNINPQATGDAAKIVRPANLRGLAPDHTLVLVNGKRRHRAAVITWIGGGLADGAQGADLSAIPAIALRQAEVLRDGASAQYGSDAIAGVMNFQLKDARSGGSVEVRGGGFLDGGGESYTVAGNVGLPFGKRGFANLSAEYGNANPTSRSVQRGDASLLVAAGNTHVLDPAQIWGSPTTEDDFKLWGNFGSPIGENIQLYGHANYSSETVHGAFAYRNPNTRSAVFSNDGGKTLLIGDVLDARDGVPDGSAGCPTVSITDALPDPEALNRVLADPNCFSFQEMFPGGFTPEFGGYATDASLVAGARGLAGDLSWDVSATFGSNEVDFFIYNTVNASLGPNSPSEFDPGLYRQQDFNLNADFSLPISRSFNLASGAEWRNEEFTIGLGDEESWTIGPYAAQGFSSGSNGFPGFGPIAAGSWDRSNYAVYVDGEAGDLLGGAWSVGAAARYEHFDDFGATANGKLAFRVRMLAGLALRGSVATGFRAPTPGQQNAFNVTTEFDRELFELVNNGTIPSTSRVAELRGGKALDPETARTGTIGLVFDEGPLLVTLDLFNINVWDRIALTRVFELTTDEKTQLLNEGIASARNLQNFRFFTNDFRTQTQGLDLVATYSGENWRGTDISLALNFTRTKVVEYNPEQVSDVRLRQLTEGLPRVRWLLTGRHRLGADWNLLGRISYYGGWYDYRDDYAYPGDALVDLELSWDMTESTTLTIGGQNAFNNYPLENPSASFTGNRYSRASPFGSNGGFYYARVGYRWN